MVVACKNCPLRKRPIFSPFTPDELAFMQSFKTGELRVDAGTTVFAEESKSPQLYTVLDGMGTRYKTLKNGRRQVLNFLLPGDFIGLQAGLMDKMRHSAAATTGMVLCVFQRSALSRLFRKHPDRALDLTWLAAVEEHLLGETLVTLGQRDARQRIAWALVRIHERLRAVGKRRGDGVPMPFRQQDMADALGMSLVHTNKTLTSLRARRLATWQDGTLTIHDLPALADMALIDLDAPQQRPLM